MFQREPPIQPIHFLITFTQMKCDLINGILQIGVIKCAFSDHDLTFSFIKSKTAAPKEKHDTCVTRDMKQFQHEQCLEDIDKLISSINFNIQYIKYRQMKYLLAF